MPLSMSIFVRKMKGKMAGSKLCKYNSTFCFTVKDIISELKSRKHINMVIKNDNSILKCFGLVKIKNFMVSPNTKILDRRKYYANNEQI